jgi:hypothetical protein
LNPASVVSIATMRPELAVITPADRSNSPPIISSATTTAMMPSVEAGSSMLPMPRAVANWSV